MLLNSLLLLLPHENKINGSNRNPFWNQTEMKVESLRKNWGKKWEKCVRSFL